MVSVPVDCNVTAVLLSARYPPLPLSELMETVVGASTMNAPPGEMVIDDEPIELRLNPPLPAVIENRFGPG